MCKKNQTSLKIAVVKKKPTSLKIVLILVITLIVNVRVIDLSLCFIAILFLLSSEWRWQNILAAIKNN